MEAQEKFLDKGATIKSKSRRIVQYEATIAVSLGLFCTGNCLGWTSPTIPQFTQQINATETDTNSSIRLTDLEVAFVGGILLFGAMLSSVPAGYISYKFGRKITMILISLLFSIHWLIIIFAQNAFSLIIARFIAGISIGASTAVVPTYIGEIAEASIRGRLGSFTQLFLSLGILVAYVTGTYITWRYFSGILLIITIIFCILCFFIPESPYYLVQKNKFSEAQSELVKFRGEHYEIGEEMDMIKENIEESRRKTVKFKDILKSKANRRALFCVGSVAIFQQVNGICAITFYAVPIFQTSGSNLSAEYISFIIALMELSGSSISTLIIEKYNRKSFLIFSSTGMAISLLCLATYFQLKYVGIDISSIRFLPALSAILFMGFYGLGYGGIPFLLIGEMFSPEVKGPCAGAVISTNWLIAFVISFSYPILDDILGTHVLFYTFGILMIIASIFVHFVLPETRGKTLMEIQQILSA